MDTQLGLAGERNMEKKFRKWLGDCHAQLDRHVRFEQLGDAALQVGLFALAAHCTVRQLRSVEQEGFSGPDPCACERGAVGSSIRLDAQRLHGP